MSFERAVTHVLLHEGGYSNDPNDPGGETQYGISKRAYPNEDIKGHDARAGQGTVPARLLGPAQTSTRARRPPRS